jgi:hypothetical protein
MKRSNRNQKEKISIAIFPPNENACTDAPSEDRPPHWRASHAGRRSGPWSHRHAPAVLSGDLLQAAGEEPATILRLNGLLNDLIAKEVGVNDGRFLPQEIRPK